MANQSIIIGGKTISLVTPKADLNIPSRLPGGKYHVPSLLDEHWANVNLLLEITGSGARNAVTGMPFSLLGGASLVQGDGSKGNSYGILMPNAGSPYASTPHDPSLILGAGDFTIECTVNPINYRNGNGAGASSYFMPLLFWGTYAASGQPVNIGLWYNSVSKTFGLTLNTHATYTIASPAMASVIALGQDVDICLVRKAGLVSFYVNGSRIGSPISLGVANTVQTSAQPFYLGRMLGGVGDVNWYAAATIKALRMTKGVARYDGLTYTVPEIFPNQATPVTDPDLGFKSVSLFDLIGMGTTGLTTNASGEVYAAANQQTAPGDGKTYPLLADPNGRLIKSIRGNWRYALNTGALTAWYFGIDWGSAQAAFVTGLYDEWNNQVGFRLFDDTHLRTDLQTTSWNGQLVFTFPTPVAPERLVAKIGGRTSFTYSPAYVKDLVVEYVR